MMKIGQVEIDVENIGIREAVEGMIEKAESKYPDDSVMAMHELETQYAAWAKMAKIKTNCKKIGK